jgi:hypothetical protein
VNVKHEMEVQSGVLSACDSMVNSSGDLLNTATKSTTVSSLPSNTYFEAKKAVER